MDPAEPCILRWLKKKKKKTRCTQISYNILSVFLLQYMTLNTQNKHSVFILIQSNFFKCTADVCNIYCKRLTLIIA